MAEHIDNRDLLGSGGHVWIWAPPAITRKSVSSAGIKGTYGMVTAIGARRGRIAGRAGRPAVLKAAGADKAACDAAMTLLENAIEGLIEYGDEVGWEDDQVHSGTALVLLGYNRMGDRLYNGDCTAIWQYYTLAFEERNGGW